MTKEVKNFKEPTTIRDRTKSRVILNSTSNNNHTSRRRSSIINNPEKTNSFDLKNQVFTLFLIVLVSIIINIIYFHFIYLPQTSTHLKQKQINYEHIVFPPLLDHNTKNNNPVETSNQQEIITVVNDDETPFKRLDYDHEQDTLTHTEKKREAHMAVNLALQMQNEGKTDKAAKIFKYALSLDPDNVEALTFYGEYLELHKKDILKAEHFYTRVLTKEPTNDKALLNLRRTLPLVNKLDRIMLDQIDSLLKEFYQIPVSSSALRRAKRDAYFMHIYHSNAIEGNTLNLQQTRHILENRIVISGKSLLEHQEVLGLDAALRFINDTLLHRQVGELSLNDILEIHRRVLGFCDPIESGKLREHQVYVGDFVPPAPHLVKPLMDEFIDWLNEIMLDQAIHPIQIAALVHYKFVYIHPFYDGNGRTGRLLMNLILMKSGYPPVIIKKEERLEYYEYLEQANQGDVKPFIRFIAKCTQRTLREYIQLCSTTAFGISVDNESKMIRSDLVVNSYLANFKRKNQCQKRSSFKNSPFTSRKMNFYDFLNQFSNKR